MSAEGPTRAAECDPGPKLPTAAGGVRWAVCTAEAAPRTRHGRLPVGKPALLSTLSHSAADSTESELNTAVYNRPIVKLLHSVGLRFESMKALSGQPTVALTDSH